MITKSWMAVRTDYKLIILTFELFWIVVFLLDRSDKRRPGESLSLFTSISERSWQGIANETD